MPFLPLAWVEPRALARAVLGCSALTIALLAGAGAVAPTQTEVLAARTPVLEEAPLLTQADAPASPVADGRPRLIKAGFMPEFASSAAALKAVDPFRGSGRPHLQANARDLECMTEAVYFEARGEPLAGQGAVAQVILNRSRHPAYPKSVCAVIYQGKGSGTCQFSFACAPRPMARGSRGYREAYDIASAALEGRAPDYVGTATHFHATRVRPGWSGLTRVSTVGRHVFYRFSGSRGAQGAFSRAPTPSRGEGRSLTDALLAAVKKPLDGVLHGQAVTTVAPPPAPVISLAPAEIVVAPTAPPPPIAVPAAPSKPALVDAGVTETPAASMPLLAPAEVTIG